MGINIHDLPPKYQAQARRQIARTSAHTQPPSGDDTLGPQEVERFNGPVNIHVLILRHRLTDADEKGGRCKYFVDALVDCKILRGDTTKDICRYEQEQRKVGRSEKEETIITIEEV